MPRILIDPNTLLAPDYASAQMAAPRDALKAIVPTLTEAQVVAALASAWQAEHAQRLADWTAQQAADALLLVAAQQQEDDQTAARDILRAKEIDDAREEDRKKNGRKFLPLVPRKRTAMLARLPLPYATRRMEKCEWLPLWFYSPDGFKAASAANGRGEDDLMTLTSNEDGSLTTASNAKAPRDMVADRDIGFEFFCLASVNMLEAMRSAAWPDERIAMFASFWSEIQEHSLRHTGEELDRRVLLLYQEEERRRWHHTVASSADSPYDMSNIDAEILAEVKDRLYAADREKHFKLQMSVSFPAEHCMPKRF